MLKRFAPLALTALIAAVASTPAAAYNCAIPAIIDQTKRTVCANQGLRDLDQSEKARFASVNATLGTDGRRSLTRARAAFFTDRDACGGTDTRCLTAVYRAQVRLYARFTKCRTNRAQGTCIEGIFQRHREELHRST